MAKVFLGCPTHDGRVHDLAAKYFYKNESQRHETEGAVATFSLITFNCNLLWSVALNRSETGRADWFAMLHSDVEPGMFWIDKLIDEAEHYDADIVTSIVPIKTDQGLTSTALSHPADDCLGFFRLTMSQVLHPSFPRTFDRDMAIEALRNLPDDLAVETPLPTTLLCNTGCMVCRLNRPWCDPTKVFFDEMTSFMRTNGEWTPIIRSEDWVFTSKAAHNGAKVMATTVLPIRHHGSAAFPGDQKWGVPVDAEGLARWGASLESVKPKRNPK
jgi:hypothetical protein